MSHIFIQGNPLLLNDDLGLKRKYGLRYVFPDVPMMSVWEDGTTLPLHRDPAKSAAAIAQVQRRRTPPPSSKMSDRPRSGCR